MPSAGIRPNAPKAVVNAAGPWVSELLTRRLKINDADKVRLVKGSHIIVAKFWEGPNAYLVQNTDKRVIFINPYEGDLALIGTTDIPWEDRAEDVTISDNEIDYLLAASFMAAPGGILMSKIIMPDEPVREPELPLGDPADGTFDRAHRSAREGEVLDVQNRFVAERGTLRLLEAIPI